MIASPKRQWKIARLRALACGMGSALALAGCGTQINTLRSAARSVTGAALGVPPAVTSLAIADPSPTRSIPLTLNWGIAIGAHTQYCILENMTTPAACVWLSGALPTSYADSSADGSLVLTAFVKNAYGVSEAITSNTVTIDRTPPSLASAAVANASPTNTTAFTTSFGAVTNGSYASYCVLENSTAVSSCSWVSGTLPASVNVAPTDESKTLTFWVRDAAGNVSGPATTNAVVLDLTAPTVSIVNPAAGTVINTGNMSSFAVSGACSETGRTVVLSGAISGTANCSGGAWSANLDLSSVADGSVTIHADLSDAAGNAGTQASRTFTKSTTLPALAITSPTAGASMNAANKSAFTVSGTCSVNGRTVTFSGDASGSATCTAGAWSANLDFSAAADGTVTLHADFSDASGNSAPQATRTFTKDTSPPTVAITSPAAGSVVNTVNMGTFAVSGTCSEDGRTITLSGDASATATCSSGSWSKTLDLTSASDGTVTIRADLSDAAGNAAIQSVRTFTKSTGTPTLTIASPSAGAYVNLANQSAFSVGGACSANGQTVTVSGAASATATCTAGAWSASLNLSAAAAGSVSISVDLSDSSGNPAITQNRSFTKDVTAPTVAITSPAAGSSVSAANANAWTVSGTCSENGQTVALSGSASATAACAGGIWSKVLDVSGVADGTITIHADLSDAAGNPATQDTRTFTKDTALPTVAITSPAAASYVNGANKTAFAVSGACSENGRSVAISGAGTATASCTAGAWSANVDVSGTSDGSIVLYADLSDAAGNPAAQASRSFTKDTVPPTVALTSPAAGTYISNANVSSFPISGTCSDTGAMLIDVATTPASGFYGMGCSGTWSHSGIPLNGVADGSVTITVTHHDAAGNSATASVTYTKDTSAPAAATVLGWAQSSPSTSTSVTATWTKSAAGDLANQTIQFYADSGCSTASGTSTDLASATTQAKAWTAPSTGTYAYKVTSIDVAGNLTASACSSAMTISSAASPAGAGHSTLVIPSMGGLGSADNSSSTSVIITLKDASNNPISGVTPAFEIVNGAGTYTVTSACTASNASGVSTCAFRTFRGGKQIVRVSSPAGLTDVLATPTIPCAASSTYFGAAAGTAVDPYLVDSPAKLDQIRCFNGYYSLSGNVDLTGIEWLPPVTAMTTGFEGNSRTITALNAQIDFPTYYAAGFDPGGASFFGKGPTTATSVRTFQNVTFASPVVKAIGTYNGSHRSAGVVSFQTRMQVKNVVVTNGVVYGSAYVGGILGQLSSASVGADPTKDGLVQACSFAGTITTNNYGDDVFSAPSATGGIVGLLGDRGSGTGRGGYVNSNTFTGTLDTLTYSVWDNAISDAGGIVGYAELFGTNTGERYGIDNNTVEGATLNGGQNVAGIVGVFVTRQKSSGSEIPSISGNYVHLTNINSLQSDVSGFAGRVSTQWGGDYAGKEIIIERNAIVGGSIVAGHEDLCGFFCQLEAPVSFRDNYLRGTLMDLNGQRGFGSIAVYPFSDFDPTDTVNTGMTNLLYEVKRSYIAPVFIGGTNDNAHVLFGSDEYNTVPTLGASDDVFYDATLAAAINSGGYGSAGSLLADVAPLADNGVARSVFKSGTPFAGWSTSVWDFTAGSYPRLKSHPNGLSASESPIYPADDFSSNTLPSLRWESMPSEITDLWLDGVFDPNASTYVNATGGQLVVSCPTTGRAYGVATAYSYDMTGASFSVRQVQRPVLSGNYVESAFYVSPTTNGRSWGFVFPADTNEIVYYNAADDSKTSQTYNPATHRYLRIRHDSGTDTINWETSSDGSTWTTRRSIARGTTAVDAVRASFTAGWNDGSSATAAIFDDFSGIAVRNGP